MRPILPALALALAACFPTFQTARIDPGVHLDAGVTYLNDQPRNAEPQGNDYLAYLSPSVGFSDRVEIGLPLGFYLQDGLADRYALLMPYLKLATLGPDSRDHLAVVAQGWLALPANLGLIYGRDMGGWEPQLRLSTIFSGGAAGDDQYVTRYQEHRQTMFALAVGASWKTAGRPAIEAGVLRNHYREGARFGDFGQPTMPRTYYDLFVAFRVGIGR
jgi:hypothetical protein